MIDAILRDPKVREAMNFFRLGCGQRTKAELVQAILSAAVPSEAREEAAKAMYESDVSATPQSGYQPQWDELASGWREMYYRRVDSISPILTRALSAENAELRSGLSESSPAFKGMMRRLTESEADLARAREERNEAEKSAGDWSFKSAEWCARATSAEEALKKVEQFRQDLIAEEPMFLDNIAGAREREWRQRVILVLTGERANG